MVEISYSSKVQLPDQSVEIDIQTILCFCYVLKQIVFLSGLKSTYLRWQAIISIY